MKKISLIAFFIFASFSIISKQTSAAVIYDMNMVSEFSWTSYLGSTASSLFFNYNADPLNTLIFNDIALNVAAIGQTFTVSAATHPNFSNFVAYATNGVDDFATWGLQWGSVDGLGNFTAPVFGWALNNPEYGWWTSFFVGTPLPWPVDLQGYQIDSIQLTLNDYQEGNAGLGFSRLMNYTVTVNGTAVPEPTSFVLVGLSLLGLVFKRFKN